MGKALRNKRRAENKVEKAGSGVRCTKDSDSNPSVVSRDVLEDTAIGVGEFGHKEAQCWFKQEYTRSSPQQDPLQRDIREWTNPSEKGQGHNQPKGKGKGKGKGKIPRTRNHNQAGSPDEET